jgi:hypothetical protein
MWASGQILYKVGISATKSVAVTKQIVCGNLSAFGNSDDMTIWFKLKANQKANETTYQLD